MLRTLERRARCAINRLVSKTFVSGYGTSNNQISSFLDASGVARRDHPELTAGF